MRPLLVVEAPGYCPPGPKCLFHPTLYRHSRVAPAGAKIGIRSLTNKNRRLRSRYDRLAAAGPLLLWRR